MATRSRSERHVRRVKATRDVPIARSLAVSTAAAGLKDVPTATAMQAPDGTAEYGASGTFNYAGYITGEDYNPKLDGLAALDVYDEMRKSDAQVRASLLAIKLPLKSATWTIQPPKNGDAQDQAVADFVRACLLEDEALADPWLQVLDHLLLSLDFGFSVMEKVWTAVDEVTWRELETPGLSVGATRVTQRLARLAPRLPRTIHRWIADPLGRLQQIVQFAPKDGRYQYLTMPAEQCLVIAREREGDNWYGRGLLRSAYMHWFYKTQAYRIAGVALDRFGIGIPRAKITAEFQSDEKALAKVEQTLKGLRTHERAYVVEKPGLAYDFLMPEGGKAMAEELPAVIDHHNTMIARNVLAGFMAQQESKFGSRSTTETLADLFLSSLKGEATLIGASVRQQVIKPLCDLNFDMAGRRYPQLDASDLSSLDLDKMADRLQKFVSGKLLTPDDEIEELIREQEGLPPMPDDLKGRRKAMAEIRPPSDPAARPGGPEPDPEDDPEGADPQKTPAQEPALRLRKGGWEEGGLRFAREPTAFERQVFALFKVPDRLNDAHALLVRALGDIRRRQLETFAARLAKKDSRTTGDFTDLRPSQVGSMPLVAELRRAIRATQDQIFAYGQQTVLEELARQGAPLTAAAKVPAKSPGENTRVATSALVSSAAVTAEKLGDLWRARILETAARFRRVGLQGEALVEAIYTALQDEIEAGARRDAAAEIHEAFAIGRELSAQQEADHIEKAIYSCLLDEHSCEVCASWDGTEMQIGDETYLQCLPPHKDCEGNKGVPDACRCVLLFVYQGATS